MQYMLLIYDSRGAYEDEKGKAKLADIVGKHMKLAGELREKGVMVSGNGPAPAERRYLEWKLKRLTTSR